MTDGRARSGNGGLAAPRPPPPAPSGQPSDSVPWPPPRSMIAAGLASVGTQGHTKRGRNRRKALGARLVLPWPRAARDFPVARHKFPSPSEPTERGAGSPRAFVQGETCSNRDGMPPATVLVYGPGLDSPSALGPDSPPWSPGGYNDGGLLEQPATSNPAVALRGTALDRTRGRRLAHARCRGERDYPIDASVRATIRYGDIS